MVYNWKKFPCYKKVTRTWGAKCRVVFFVRYIVPYVGYIVPCVRYIVPSVGYIIPHVGYIVPHLGYIVPYITRKHRTVPSESLSRG